MDSEVPCDPHVFYPEVYQSEKSVRVETALITVLACISLLLSPAIIVSPFIVKNLASTARKIIAMISLSDLLQTVGVLICRFMQDEWRDGESLLTCKIVSFITNANVISSTCWALLLLVHLWLTIQDGPWVNLDYSTNRFFLGMHLLCWGCGMLPLALPYLFWDVRFQNNYVVNGFCAPEINFVTSPATNSTCVPSVTSRHWLMSFYLPLLVIVSLAVCMFVLVLVWAAGKMQVQTRGRRGTAVSGDHLMDSEIVNTSISTLEQMRNVEFMFKERRLISVFVKLELTSLLYLVCYAPVFIKQFVEIYRGPINKESHPAAHDVLVVWLPLSLILPGLGNIVIFGFCSRIFRQEMRNFLRRRYLLWLHRDTLDTRSLPRDLPKTPEVEAFCHPEQYEDEDWDDSLAGDPFPRFHSMSQSEINTI